MSFILMMFLIGHQLYTYNIIYTYIGEITITITINDNELFIQTKSNEKYHKGNINNTYKNINIATFVPRRLHLKTSWPLAYNHL